MSASVPTNVCILHSFAFVPWTECSRDGAEATQHLLPSSVKDSLQEARLPAPGVLNSWKDIAKHVGRGVRTVQRWEATLGMPVHRPAGHARGAVFAFADEIDRWMRSAKTRALLETQIHGSAEIQRVVDGDGSALRAFDWSKTPLGPVQEWPQDLQTRVSQFIEVRDKQAFSNSVPIKDSGMPDGDSRKSVP